MSNAPKKVLDEPHEFYKEFDFLSKVRDSGKINMMSAPPYLAKAFEIDIHEARRIWGLWTESF